MAGNGHGVILPSFDELQRKYGMNQNALSEPHLYPDRGIGLRAKVDIACGVPVAFWLCKPLPLGCNRTSDYTYTSRNGYMCDLSDYSFPSWSGRIPCLGYLANEPLCLTNLSYPKTGTRAYCGWPNARAVEVDTSSLPADFPGRSVLQSKNYVVVKLLAARFVPAGQEITWDYGKSYTREYASRYDWNHVDG